MDRRTRSDPHSGVKLQNLVLRFRFGVLLSPADWKPVAKQNGQNPIPNASENLNELFASIGREVPEAEWKKVPTDLSKK